MAMNTRAKWPFEIKGTTHHAPTNSWPSLFECTQCTPSREGMGWLEKISTRIVAGGGVPSDIDRLYQISNANDGTTICGLGDAAGYATVGILDKYRHEFEYYIENKRSMFDGRLEVLT